MFIDYYCVLEINFDVSPEVIKTAYKTQALKWHPDRNAGVDTTVRMQQINEAYLILKDIEARQRYDIEYQKYHEHQRMSSAYEKQKEYKNTDTKEQTSYKAFTDDAYELYDETLNKWMSNARKQAVNLAKQTIEDIVGMSKASGKAMAEEAGKGVISLIIFSIVIAILFKACQ